MGEIHFYQRPWFFLIFSIILIVVSYFIITPNDVDYATHLTWIVSDLLIYFGLLLIWLAFFSQFVLPVQTFRERQKIFDRLLLYIAGMHGPAIFFRDGQPIQGEREDKKDGPGVLWLDSASAVVTRNDAAFKHTFGPGVNFTEKGEKIAGQVDLHTQTHGMGPRDRENPFAKKSDDQTGEAFESMQQRRNQTSALTRDGIEVVPNINVTFKIDADPIKDSGLPGSRFGFDENAVRRAITGQAINPNAPKDSYTHRVHWNQLPALVAADVWRDLLSKFTLNDLFEAKFAPLPSFPNPPALTSNDDSLNDQTKHQSKLADSITLLVKELNRSILQLANWIEERCNPKQESNKVEPNLEKALEKSAKELPKEKWTGLQVINFLIRERLQKYKTAKLDPYGNYIPDGGDPSHEYNFLQNRGIRVLSASVSNLQLPEDVDDKMIKQWTANWLGRAREEQDRLNQEEAFSLIAGQENALRDYIVQLSDDLLSQIANNRARDLRETLRSLLLESRVVLVNETQLYRQSSPERDGLEEIIQWLETRDL